MPTTFRLLRWRSQGFRCPDHEIQLGDADGVSRAVTLIQMPNGTGKTTTLKLLRATLSGEANSWSESEVRELQKKDSPESKAQFLVDAVSDGNRLTLVLDLDFEEGVATYSTTVGSGKKVGFQPPSALKRFLKPDFVRLFVFDGEQAEELLSSKHTKANDALDSLFQLRHLDRMAGYVEDFWDDASKAKASEDKGLNRRKNRVQLLRDKLSLCKSQYVESKRIRDNKSAELESKQRQFRDELQARTEYSEKVREAERELDEAKSELRRQTLGVHARMRDPHSLSPTIARKVAELRLNLDRVKLPESAAREFFEELVDEETCICGRPIDAEAKEKIRERASRYLGSEDVSLLNAMKSDIASWIGDDSSNHSLDLDSLLSSLGEASRREREARTNKDVVESEAVAGDPELENIENALSVLREELDRAKDVVDRFESADDFGSDEETFGVKVLERRLADAERKLAEITQTLELKKKRDTLKSILVRAHVLAREAICVDAVAKANERIEALLPENAIRIKNIQNSLILDGQAGGSMGETLSVAYAFLATFFNSADHQFPFVVDSPAGSIDLSVRPRIAELLPALTSQFVAFTISSEREQFTAKLAEGRSDTQFVTLFRKGNADLDDQAKSSQDTVESADGLVVFGREFFDQFQVLQEVQ